MLPPSLVDFETFLLRFSREYFPDTLSCTDIYYTSTKIALPTRLQPRLLDYRTGLPTSAPNRPLYLYRCIIFIQPTGICTSWRVSTLTSLYVTVVIHILAPTQDPISSWRELEATYCPKYVTVLCERLQIDHLDRLSILDANMGHSPMA